jgi:hypothetical protein
MGKKLSLLIGPVNIFNMTTRAPSATDLAGHYEFVRYEISALRVQDPEAFRF